MLQQINLRSSHVLINLYTVVVYVLQIFCLIVRANYVLSMCWIHQVIEKGEVRRQKICLFNYLQFKHFYFQNSSKLKYRMIFPGTME